MPTMTLSEAQHIIDVVASSLQQERRYHVLPMSLLQGYDLKRISVALKLRVAGMFLAFADGTINDEEYKSELENCDATVWSVAGSFVDDDEIIGMEADHARAVQQLEQIAAEQGRNSTAYRMKELDIRIAEHKLFPSGQLIRASDEELNPDFAELETATSFARLCESIGSDDPLYWQKVYSRMDLEYTSECPRGNSRVNK